MRMRRVGVGDSHRRNSSNPLGLNGKIIPNASRSAQVAMKFHLASSASQSCAAKTVQGTRRNLNIGC